MTPARLLLLLAPAGLLAQGFRSPAVWALGAAALWWAVWSACRRLSPEPLAWWAPWLAWAGLAALASGQPAASLPSLARWAAYAAFAAAAAQLWGAADRRLWVRVLLWSGLGAAAAAALTGWRDLAQAGVGTGFTGLLPPYYNYTAFVEAAAFAAAASLIGRSGQGAPRKALVVAVLLACAAGLVLAKARGAMLAAGLGAAAAAWLRRGPGPLVAGAVLAGAVLAAGGLAAVLKLDKAGAFRRPQLWSAAVQTAAESPWLGEGPGQFEKGFRRRQFAEEGAFVRYGRSSEQAHSEPLGAAAETGFAGLALLLLALLSLRGRTPDSWEGQAALTALVAMAAHCLVDNLLHVPTLALLAFGAAACAWPRPAAEKSAPAWTAFAAAGLALSLLAPVPGALARRWSAESGPPQARLDRARRLAALYPLEPRAREALARALQAQDPPRLEEAAEQLEAAAALSPRNAYYRVWLAELRRAQGRWAEAEALALDALDLEPNFLQARLLAAEADARAGRAAEARRGAAAIRALEPEAAPRRREGGYAALVASVDEARLSALEKGARSRGRR